MVGKVKPPKGKTAKQGLGSAGPRTSRCWWLFQFKQLTQRSAFSTKQLNLSSSELLSAVQVANLQEAMTNLRSKGDYRLELFVEASPSVQVLSNLGLRLWLEEGRAGPLRSQIDQHRRKTWRAESLSQISCRRPRPGAFPESPSSNSRCSFTSSGSNRSPRCWPCPWSRCRTNRRCPWRSRRARVGVADAESSPLSRCVAPGSPHLLRYQCGSREVHLFQPPPTRPISKRDVVVDAKEVVWILGRQPIWRQMRCDSLSHQENTWARFTAQAQALRSCSNVTNMKHNLWGNLSCLSQIPMTHWKEWGYNGICKPSTKWCGAGILPLR